jgi:GNAT superfamily N-acetyltransferase
MHPVLRPATEPADLDRLLPLMAQFYAHFGYPYQPDRHRAVVRGFLANPHLGLLYLIYAHDQPDTDPAGYAALTFGFTFEFGGRDAFLDEFFIEESHRSTGLGRAVLAQLQAEAHRLSLVALHLQTEVYNPRAKRLYESVGFRDLNRNTLTWRVE